MASCSSPSSSDAARLPSSAAAAAAGCMSLRSDSVTKPVVPIEPSSEDIAPTPKRSSGKVVLTPLLEESPVIKSTKKKLVVALCGLPGRGKTYMAMKIGRWLTWQGFNTAVFNTGRYRQAKFGMEKKSEFFDPSNRQAATLLRECSRMALRDLSKFLQDGGQAAIYDASNISKEQRRGVVDTITTAVPDVDVLWVESVLNDKEILQANILETKLFSPDYAKMDQRAALEDFSRRIAHYESVYETISDAELSPVESYVKIIDCGRQFFISQVSGYLPGRIVLFLMQLRVNKSLIYITRHGESEYNLTGRLGGNPALSARGVEYATVLGQWIVNEPEIKQNVKNLGIWCSTLNRATQTAEQVYKATGGKASEPVEWRSLCEIETGEYDGLTYEEVRKKAPEEFAARNSNKLTYRYPQGESYVDVINRLESVIFEIERQRLPVLLIGHQAVLRCLYGYFLDRPLKDIPYLDVPLHTVIKLTPKACFCKEERFKLVLPSERKELLMKRNVNMVTHALSPSAERTAGASCSRNVRDHESAREREQREVKTVRVARGGAQPSTAAVQVVAATAAAASLKH